MLPNAATASNSSLSNSKAMSQSVCMINQKNSVFDRLTDSRAYTGTHKERFDAHGNGLGLAGRDHIAKGTGTTTTYRGGPVSSLAQILRS